MSKIICDVCGTSYPETAEQCPICGCVRPADASSVAEGAEKKEGYTYVKGGRFSKANVRKRNGGPVQPIVRESDDDEKEPTNKGLIITAVLLVVAILLLLVYVFFQFFGGRDGAASKPTTPPSTEALVVECTDLQLDVRRIVFAEANESRMLYVDAYPQNTTDEILFESSDESIVTVSNKGKVTAIAPGEAYITVKCGTVSIVCDVECAFEVESTEETVDETTEVTEPTEVVELKLNRSDITFSYQGESWILYNGEIPAEEIKWTSGNENFCTVENGRVVAVGHSGNYYATITAEYKGQKATCIIRCNFSNSGSGVAGNGGVSEDG
jgi:hypothetical protein